MSDGAEKRKYTRYPLIAEIQYESDSPMLTARISDISLGGLFIDTVNTLDIESKVKFSLLLPAEISTEPIQGEGIVTWCQSMMGMGIRFTRMTRDDWEKIRSFVRSAEE